MRYFFPQKARLEVTNVFRTVRVVKEMDVLKGHMRCIQFDVFSVVKRRWLV